QREPAARALGVTGRRARGCQGVVPPAAGGDGSLRGDRDVLVVRPLDDRNRNEPRQERHRGEREEADDDPWAQLASSSGATTRSPSSSSCCCVIGDGAPDI